MTNRACCSRCNLFIGKGNPGFEEGRHPTLGECLAAIEDEIDYHDRVRTRLENVRRELQR